MHEGFYDPFCLLYDVSTEMCLDSFEPQYVAEHTCLTVTSEQLLHCCHVCVLFIAY
jgi:hypothetical protein